MAYLRVSTDRQELGPEAQRAAIEAWAARGAVRVLAWHEDRVSGSAGIEGRPGLMAALADLSSLRAGVLVAHKRDRLARDVMVTMLIERDVAARGAVVRTTDGVGEGDDPSAVLMRRLLDSFAEYERAMIRARTKAALGAKRRRGERAGNVPFGFRAERATGVLSPEPAEAAVVLRVLALRAPPASASLRGIVRRLAVDGARGRTGRPLGYEQVRRIVLASRKEGPE